MHAAWFGRVAGCNLGKPVEDGDHWTVERIRDYLEITDSYALSDYILALDLQPEGFAFRDCWPESTRGNIDSSARDDDIDYTILGLHLLETHGRGLHLQFLLSIIKALWLPVLELLIEPLQELIIVSSIPPPEPESGEQWGIGSHDPIVEALESGDPEAARAAVRDHFRYAESPPYREYGQTLFRDARLVLAGLR